MASKVLLVAFLLVCVCVCHGHDHLKHHQGDETSENQQPVRTGECPEFECVLCSTPEYDVRRYKSALWVSTTMSDLSLSQASGRGRKRLHEYFEGENDKGLKMSYVSPLMTQTRMPSESPVREITVSTLLPVDVAKNPPKPTDPRVVIDLVPETLLYVKKFQGRPPGVGFVADLEAKKFFKTLKANDEPIHENEGYYYVAQYPIDSQNSSTGHSGHLFTEIAVFAMNERTYKWLEFNDLTAVGQGLPKCLRDEGKTVVWEKMDQSDIPLLTREQCSTTYCEAPKKCPKVETMEVKGIDDKSIQLKKKKDIKALSYIPPTCYYDTAIHASASPLLQSLNTSDFSPSDVAMTITVVMEKREELDGKEGCQKVFKVLYAAGGGKGSVEEIQMNKEAGFQTPKTVEAVHQGQTTGTRHYSKCFGGNAYYEPTTITSTAKILMERLRDKKKCFLGDHVSVVEYHPQSRLFDRHNEINLDVDLDCSDQEGRPPFTFHLPVSKDYSRAEVKPSLGDQCVTHVCPNMTTIMRLENNLKLIEYGPVKWIYSKLPAKNCYGTKSYHKALNPLLSYLNGENEDEIEIDMTRPLYGGGDVYVSEKKCYLSTLMPEKFFDNPPKPTNDQITVGGLKVGSRYFQAMYKGTFEAVTKQGFKDLKEELDNLKPFGVQVDLEDMWLGAYDDPYLEERLWSLEIGQKKVTQEGSEDKTSTEAGKEDVNEDPSDENIPLPKPEGCSESVCPTVYVTKNHSNFMELLLPHRRSVCHQTKLCGGLQVSGRQLMRPILGYLNGDNSANQKINNFAVPLFKTRLYSAKEEEKGIPPCEREYQACVRLPDDYKEIPNTNTERLSIFTADEHFRGYGIAVKGYVSEPVASEAIWTLMQTLDEENVPYDKTWVAYFSYDKPLSNPEEKTTYFLFIKMGEDIGEGPTERDSNETEN
ncbi:PREDICTED: uncharacterized protein LOC109465506 [Branchiostoma belcheri]|uniref:Uncharacterized protein LOC109465506 n=1 Tax=Branchiostoma belcheri TaxID=7741 RepID=A0A6P4YMN3_BRABE|nr:PREDICTED: uncharacterized protein LOC109465506 [Branchiostoma belcheri]